jgi:hypothetical protein
LGFSQRGKGNWPVWNTPAGVRDALEFEKIRNYIEQNPVRAGLVREASEYRWSSAGWATRGSPADRAVGPTVAE